MLGNRGFPEAQSRLCVCQSLLPHDLCHGWSSSHWLPAISKMTNMKSRLRLPEKTPMLESWKVGGCQEPAWGTLPMAKVMRKEASAYAKVGSSLRKPLFPSIYSQNQGLPTLLFYALTYTSDFTGVGGSDAHYLSQRRSKLAAPINKNSWAWQGCLRSNLSAGRLACVTGLSTLLLLLTWLYTTSQP